MQANYKSSKVRFWIQVLTNLSLEMDKQNLVVKVIEANARVQDPNLPTHLVIVSFRASACCIWGYQWQEHILLTSIPWFQKPMYRIFSISTSSLNPTLVWNRMVLRFCLKMTDELYLSWKSWGTFISFGKHQFFLHRPSWEKYTATFFILVRRY